MTPIVSVEHRNIGDAAADVIVNASNTMLWLGSGVSGAIRSVSGRALSTLTEKWREAHPAGLPPGAVTISGAGDHPHARFIAHVAVMDYRPGRERSARPDLDRIERGCVALWHAIDGLGVPNLHIAMPALGTGTGGLGLRDSVAIACRTLRAHVDAETAVTKVTFYALELHHYVNTLDVVRRHFELPPLPKELEVILDGI